MNSNPWLKFYPQDWLGESALRLCSPAAKGLWIDMICIMHQSGGYLLNNGQIVTDRNLVSLTGIEESTLVLLKDELKTHGVFSVNNKGVIYSRRMIKDVEKSKKLKKNGKNGGNPSLCKEKEKQPLVNQTLNPLVKPRYQKPDTRKKEEDAQARSPDDPDPMRIVYGGGVLEFNLALWDKTCYDYGLKDDDLVALLEERERFLSKLPETDNRRRFWYKPTMNWIAGQLEGIKKSKR